MSDAKAKPALLILNQMAGPMTWELAEDVGEALGCVALLTGHPDTLQPTVLVHEAYLRLINQKQVTWQNRTQFFGLAAKIMRNLLVDHVRERRAEKRGGGEYHLSLSHAEQVAAILPDEKIDLLALDEALERLAGLDPQQGRIVELRYFLGLTIEQIAAALDLHPSAVNRKWESARAWLLKTLQP